MNILEITMLTKKERKSYYCEVSTVLDATNPFAWLMTLEAPRGYDSPMILLILLEGNQALNF